MSVSYILVTISTARVLERTVLAHFMTYEKKAMIHQLVAFGGSAGPRLTSVSILLLGLLILPLGCSWFLFGMSLSFQYQVLLFRDIADWLWRCRGRRQVCSWTEQESCSAVPYKQVSLIRYRKDESVVDLLPAE